MDLKITSLYENNMIYPMTRSNIGTPVEKIAPVSKTEIEKPAAIYEKSEESDLKPTYSINKMSKEERANLVSQLKADQEYRQNQHAQQQKQYGFFPGNRHEIPSQFFIEKI